MAGKVMSRHCGINGRDPAGRETVYATKGLDITFQTDVSDKNKMKYSNFAAEALHAKMR
ncbi:hypothetical protein V6C42_15675 [Pseudoclostridium thermosuccinogenes]|uniref:hypothetical protein n=1 Tax=Clostridium thermosuccinogenes TaxID=84032 RepID=UPI002FDB0406